MVVLIVITIFFHLTINSGYGPLIDYLPLSVAHKIIEQQSHDGPEPTETRQSEKNENSSA